MKWYEALKQSTFSLLTVPPARVAEEEEDIRHHAVVIDHNGRAVPIVTGDIPLWSSQPDIHTYHRPPLTPAEYEEYLEEMMKRVARHIDNEEGEEGRKGVVLIVHGGNESAKKTLKLSIELWPKILATGWYPIFVNCNSSMASAYFEQLLRIRSGRYTLWALLSAPLFLLADVLSALARIPISSLSQLRMAVRRSRCFSFRTAKRWDRFKPPPNINVWLGRRERKRCFLRWLWMQIRFPIQMLVSATLIGFVVPRAWQNLTRRNRAMFRSPPEFDSHLSKDVPLGTEFVPATGALAVLLAKLEKTLAAHPAKVRLIAHSMGSMITNQVAKHSPLLPYESIVYMAPACSVREFTEAVMPVIRCGNGGAEVYVLTLHPLIEVEQEDVGGFAPVGSVLEWLEGFLEPPSTNLDRTLGKWDNTLRTLHIFDDDVRPFIHIKGFPYKGHLPKEERKPCRHVDFNDADLEFWRKPFWLPEEGWEAPNSPSAR